MIQYWPLDFSGTCRAFPLYPFPDLKLEVRSVLARLLFRAERLPSAFLLSFQILVLACETRTPVSSDIDLAISLEAVWPDKWVTQGDRSLH